MGSRQAGQWGQSTKGLPERALTVRMDGMEMDSMVAAGASCSQQHLSGSASAISVADIQPERLTHATSGTCSDSVRNVGHGVKQRLGRRTSVPQTTMGGKQNVPTLSATTMDVGGASQTSATSVSQVGQWSRQQEIVPVALLVSTSSVPLLSSLSTTAMDMSKDGRGRVSLTGGGGLKVAASRPSRLSMEMGSQ